MGVLFALALVVESGTALLGLRDMRIPLAHLGVYFDGHLYLEIAKSFPLPYAAEGPEYLGQAPGFSACIYLARLLSFGLINWGLLAILCAWIPGALAALVFYLLCKEVAAPPFWGGVLFVLGHPIWMTRAATAHSEPLAAVFIMLCFLAYLRGSIGYSVVWLSIAALIRFPAILVGLPLAFGVLVQRRGLNLRNLALLSVPLGCFGLFNLYMYLRVPGFAGVMEAHSFWWDTSWTWPFSALLEAISYWRYTGSLVFAVTCASTLFYLTTMFVGFRPSERERWFLPLWVAAIVLFHASLSGFTGAMGFGRLTILAWPAALLIVWRAVGPLLPRFAVPALCVAVGAFGLRYASHQITGALYIQRATQPFLRETIERLDSDQPYWVDFRASSSQTQSRGTH